MYPYMLTIRIHLPSSIDKLKHHTYLSRPAFDIKEGKHVFDRP
jgi:hypothetical protein